MKKEKITERFCSDLVLTSLHDFFLTMAGHFIRFNINLRISIPSSNEFHDCEAIVKKSAKFSTQSYCNRKTFKNKSMLPAKGQIKRKREMTRSDLLFTNVTNMINTHAHVCVIQSFGQIH